MMYKASSRGELQPTLVQYVARNISENAHRSLTSSKFPPKTLWCIVRFVMFATVVLTLIFLTVSTHDDIDLGYVPTGENVYATYLVAPMNKLKIQRIIDIFNKENHLSNSSVGKSWRPDCPAQPQELRGSLGVRQWLMNEKKKILRNPSYSGSIHERVWSPHDCVSRHSVAIIIPYRNRKTQLLLLLQHLPPIMKRQQISYSIFVVEQVGNGIFNKGTLMNAGFLTALNLPAHGVMYHCFIFHDVDLLSEDDRNMYTCPEYPRHMSVAVDELNYELPYDELVGGVFAVKTEQFIKLNGFSNMYWGWGVEDDDMGLRVEAVLRWKMRPPEALGRYISIPHRKIEPVFTMEKRRALKKSAQSRYQLDGLSSVQFKLLETIEKPQYTHLYIDVGPPPKDLEQNWENVN